MLGSHPRTAAEFNEAYLSLHVPKEDLFWTTYMGTDKRPEAFEAAEIALKTFISAPENLGKARTALSECRSGSEAERIALQGWIDFFSANSIENADARELQSKLVEAEGALYQKRAKLEFSYGDATGRSMVASTNVLSVNVTTSPDEMVRKSSHDALLGLEQWVLNHGFLDLVRLRNRFARTLGYPDFFTYKLMKNEGLSVADLDGIFGPFERSTREKCFAEFARLAKEKGDAVLAPHHLLFSVMGDVTAEIDPYFPFSKSIERWGLSFWRLGIRFRGAELTLDLLDRTGKYENGFMHGPMPAYFEGDRWIPARIHFTSNATPNQVGNGKRGLDTLFHEGGHAAHFSNILQPAPCFSQEFPPTSMAFAETQSMFCDSLIGDADWQKRYAADRGGRAIPDELIRKQATLGQPLRAYRERAILIVPHFERQLYAMSDTELTAESVTRLARRCEKDIFNLEGVARPILAIPHLLSDSGACSYQGYLLAHMAVFQTRAHFLKKYGTLTDQPDIGREIAESYWSIGNRITHRESVHRLTGQALSGDALAKECTASNEDTWAEAERMMTETAKRPPIGSIEDVDLGAKIRIVHGTEVIAETKTSFAQMARDFETWIDRRYPPKPSAS